MTPSLRACALTTAAVAAAAVMLPAQTPQRPVFRSGTEIYEIEVTVLDRRREPVRGLTAEDFTVTEAGRPVRISQFSAVEFPESTGPLPPSAEIASPDLSSDQYADRRLVAIVLDDFSLAQWEGAFANRTAEIQQEVRDAARGIVQALGPKDFASVFLTMSPKIAPDFTNAWSKLASAIGTFRVRSDLERNDMLRATRGYFGPANTIRDTIAYLAKLPQHSKVIVYIGRPLPGYFPMYPLRLDDVIEDAKVAGIPIFGFDPHGPLDRSFTSFLLTMTEGTGAGAYGPGNLTQGIPRVFAETRAYYLLGFEPIGAADGKFHRLEIKVSRSGVRLRAPTGYTAAKKSTILKPEPLPFDPDLDAALKTLPGASPQKLFARAVAGENGIAVAAELDLAESGAAAWAAGADVDVQLIAGAQTVARAQGRIEPGSRGALVMLPLPNALANLRASVTVRAGGTAAESSVNVQSGGPKLGPPRVFRTTSLPRAPLGPVADFRLRQTEQLRVEWSERQPVERRQVRLLRRTGEAVGPVPTAITTDATGRSVIVVTLPLQTVAPGEYLIEAVVGDATATERQLLAFRVIQ